MNKYSEVEEEFITLSEKKIDVMPILLKYLSYWKWFLISIVFWLIIAATYIYFAIPRYEINTSILFKDDRKGGTAELNMIQDMGVVTRRNNVDNEVEIMKKSLITESVVKELDLYINYILMQPIFNLNKFFHNSPMRGIAVLYGDDLPLKMKIPEEDLHSITKNIFLELVAYPSGNFLFSGKYNGNVYNVSASSNDSIVQLPFGTLLLMNGKTKPKKEMRIQVVIQPPLKVADALVNSLEIALTSKTSSVADISFRAYNKQLGKDFLKEFVDAYNGHGIRDQLELAEKTSQVIDRHLVSLSNELNDVENQVQEFRQSRGLTDIASQADLYNAQLASVSQKKMDVETQYGIVSELLNFVRQNGDHHQLIPANSGIQSSILISHISSYNNLLQEKNRLARIASGSNQSMIDLTNEIESTFHSVVSGLQREKENLEIQLRDINSEYSRNNARIRAIPQQERAYSDIKRQQNIKEELFLYLLQKKEERYMNMTTVEPNSKLIDNIRVKGKVWPKKTIILFLFFVIGVILPIIGIKIRDLLRYQVENKEELAALSSIPILGEIPKTIPAKALVVKENNHDSFNEMLRLLRANLLFVIDGKDKKVINILSSISGEGKSFVSLNLAMSLALLDRKVLLVELDIRKPKLAKELGLDTKQGITLYLSGLLYKQALVMPSGLHPNLSVITGGAIPPNPNELLAKPALDALIDDVKNEYDYIIIDTAPVGMVSDGFLLNRFADANLFVTRAGVTPKKYIEDAERYFHENRLKNMYFILNGVNLEGSAYRYGLNKKYGYGYA